MIDLHIVLIAGIAVLVGAVVQGATGFGVGLVAAPVVTLLDPSLMPGSLLVAGFLLPLMVLATEFRHVDRRVGWIFLGRLTGTVPGAVIVALLTPAQLGIGIGVMILVAVGLTMHRFTVPVNRSTLAGAGFFSGLGATAASIGGPPLGLVLQRADARTVRSTSSLVFVVGSVVSISALTVAGEMSARELLTGLAFFPFFGVGFLLSLPLRRHLHGHRFRYAVLVVVAASAVAILVRPLIP
ncbi:MAG TPA: sulfite exporter TauE/SafE family protein [Nocardioidaceae bacterium]|nr:sulfite exporter TauE/SafE family protein [Nocardioidaceae bacterium]